MKNRLILSIRSKRNKNAFKQDAYRPLLWPTLLSCNPPPPTMCMPPCHACPPPCMPPCHTCWPHHAHTPLCMPACQMHSLPCMTPTMSPCFACPCHAHTPPAMHTPPPVNRILDTRLWKHYLFPTTVADGKSVTKSSSSYLYSSHLLAQVFFTACPLVSQFSRVVNIMHSTLGL